MKSRPRLRWLPTVGVAAVLLACGDSSSEVSDDGGTVTCPQVLPCRDNRGTPNYTVPGYTTEIRPILNVVCVPCHNNDGGIGRYSETTYMAVSDQKESMLEFLGPAMDCNMPAPTGPQLSAPQRIALEEWLSCGAPNN